MLRKKGSYKKSHSLIVGVSILITIIFTLITLLSAESAFAQDNNTSTDNKSSDFAVFVSSDGLYMSDLNKDNPVLIDNGHNIEYPIISRDGNYVAYTKEGNLSLCNIKTKETIEVAQNISSYNWNSSNNLIYSIKDQGMSLFDTNSNSSKNIIDNDCNYYSINCDSKNKIYANKSKQYLEGNDTRVELIGIISYDLDTNNENLLVESKNGTNKDYKTTENFSEVLESLGTRPTIARISSDDRYLYIWNKPRAGSMSMDMVGFAVYDTVNNEFIQNNNTNVLSYPDNIVQNPVDSNYIAVNSGENREMFSNKTLGILNIKDNTFTSLIPNMQVSMTLDYSNDGENILYSGSYNLNRDDKESINKWENAVHNIYEVNTNTKEIKKLTDSIFFDFMPKYLSDNSILFVRKSGNSYFLMKIKDGIETKIAGSLDFTNASYYGHYETEHVIDIFRG